MAGELSWGKAWPGSEKAWRSGADAPIEQQDTGECAHPAGAVPPAAPAERVPGEFREARDKGLCFLQFSSKTEAEMRKKLEEQGFSCGAVDDAVAFLKSYRYLDDAAYAARYLERGCQKKSERQLRYELKKKGVSDETVELAFEEQPVDETAQILAILEKKGYFDGEPDRAKRQKMSAFLARKGFSYDAISAAFFHCARKTGE